MQRWLAIVLGLGLAAAALYFLAEGRSQRPLSDIDADSREALERVLEQADREPAP